MQASEAVGQWHFDRGLREARAGRQDAAEQQARHAEKVARMTTHATSIGAGGGVVHVGVVAQPCSGHSHGRTNAVTSQVSSANGRPSRR